MGGILFGGVAVTSGWNTLPLGCGGLVTGMHIANDGSMVCRTDVGNIYRWSGKSTNYADGSNRWVSLLTFAGLGSSATSATYYGGYEHVLAPGNSAVHAAIFDDMTGTVRNIRLWYSTNSGATWNRSNILFTYSSGEAATGKTADSNGSLYKTCNYKIAIDPANENVAYCGVPLYSGQTAGVYTSLNQSGGSTLDTWTSVKTSGSTPVGAVTNGLSCGLAFDSSQGTTTVGGQTVTKRIILPVGGVGIYESIDGGVTFSEIATASIGTSDFYVPSGGFTAEGVYYCVVVHATAGGVWRYASGTWTKMGPSSYTASSYSATTFLIIDPRNNPTSKAYLSVTGPNGVGAGFTSTDANTAHNWAGRTGGEFPYLKSALYDIPYMSYIVGQQAVNAFAYATNACIDSSGNCFWGGNQSLFYFGTSDVDSTPSGAPNYGSSIYTYSWSMGRGMEATVSQDALCPPGGTYPVIAVQDIGAPCRGTFTTYPKDIALQFLRYTCSNLEWAADDPSFIVACSTGEQGVANVTAYQYSTNYGADGTWTSISDSPDSLWNGGGGTGIYGGQLVAADRDHWVAVPSGFNTNFTPAYTADATGAASWSLCTGLPSAKWTLRPWANGPTSKPFAVGYGTDLGTVWACLIVQGSTTATLYRSTDYGVTFSSVATWTISASTVGVYCLSVPGYPDELWITAFYTGGSHTSLWHVTGARTAGTPTLTAVSLPALAAIPVAFTLGAPASVGDYPALYLLGWTSYGATQYLYRGSYSGSGSMVTWSIFGATGTRNDLPTSCQLCGIQAIRGDWNVYGRLYVSSNQSGFAYYNP